MAFRAGFTGRVTDALKDKAIRKHGQITNQAAEEFWLGDTSGRLHPLVENDAGDKRQDPRYYLVRRDKYGPAEPVLWSGRGPFPVEAHIQVWVGYDYDGVRKILNMSTGSMIAGDANPNVYNVLDVRAHGALDTDRFPTLRSTAIGTSVTPSTKILVAEQLTWDENNEVQSFQGELIDTAADIPTAGLHRLFHIWRNHDGTLSATTSTAKGISIPISADDFQETLDTRPARAVSAGTYRLKDGQTSVTEADKWWDTRQFLNDAPPRHSWFETTDPTVTDDEDSGYGVGSFWCNNTTPEGFVCLDATAGVAVWSSLSGSAGLLNNFAATTDPTVNDDSGDGYTPGSRWLNVTGLREFVLVVSTVGAAVWLRLGQQDNYGTSTNTDPTVTDDDAAGYSVGSVWVNRLADTVWVCTDASTGAALWRKLTGITALTGDGTASGVGSVSFTLATVNGNVGSFTNADITVNAKGLITAAANGTAPVNPPFADTTALVKGSGDPTKLLRFEVDGFTTTATRVLTPPNYDGQIATLAGTETLTNKTLTSDRYNELLDTNGNISLIINTPGGTIVNQVTVTGSSSAGSPGLLATGSDTNISLNIAPKGTGVIKLNGTTVSSTDNTDDLGATANKWRNTFGYATTYEDRTAPSTPATDDLILYSKAVGSASRLFGKDDTGNEKQISESIAILWDAKTANTAGGTSSNTTWNARDLNTEHYDPDGIVTISSNKFVPVAGDYELICWSPFIGGSAAASFGRNRLFNVTGAAAVQQGMSAGQLTNGVATALLTCKFTANGSDEYRIDTYTTVGRATNGLGLPTNDGSSEIYTTVILRKVA